MSLILDGNRSLNLIPIGKRLLELAKQLAVPIKVAIHNGFRVSVWHDGDLEKIKIKAPMGAAVICSQASGMSMFTADYWQGNFVGPRPLFVGDLPPLDPLEAARSVYYFNTDLASVQLAPASVTTLGYANFPAMPSMLPTAAEMFWVSIRAKTTKNIYEHCLNYYVAAGDAPKRIGNLRLYSDIAGEISVHVLPTEYWSKTVAFWSKTYLAASSTDKRVTLGHLAGMRSDGWEEGKILGEVMFAGLPAVPLSAILGDKYTISYSEGNPVGSYAFAPSATASVVLLHGAMFLDERNSEELNTYFIDNPSEMKWKLFFSLRKDGVTYIHSSEQFITLLDQMAGGTIIGAGIDYPQAQEVFKQLFPRPNYQEKAPFDSVMFHSDTDIYTWTRKYGAFKFSTAGLTQVSLTMPIEVTGTEGVRPDITYAGAGLYLCVCQKDGDAGADTSRGVKAVYTGSPLTGWTKLPDAPLVHVRPVKVTADSVTLLGVVKVGDDHFFAAFVNGQWLQMGKIPGTITGNANWAVCLFGEGGMVKDLTSYLSPPPVLMQMPAPPYQAYEGVIP